ELEHRIVSPSLARSRNGIPLRQYERERSSEQGRIRTLAEGRQRQPRGRPKSQAVLSRSARKLVGEDGEALIQIWWEIARDPRRRDSDRLRASELLAERGWGKPPAFEAVEGNPLGLEDAEAAAEEFRAKIAELAARQDEE